MCVPGRDPWCAGWARGALQVVVRREYTYPLRVVMLRGVVLNVSRAGAGPEAFQVTAPALPAAWDGAGKEGPTCRNFPLCRLKRSGSSKEAAAKWCPVIMYTDGVSVTLGKFTLIPS